MALDSTGSTVGACSECHHGDSSVALSSSLCLLDTILLLLFQGHGESSLASLIGLSSLNTDSHGVGALGCVVSSVSGEGRVAIVLSIPLGLVLGKALGQAPQFFW